MAIYAITTSGETEKRYVEAVSAADALNHVAGEYFSVEPVKPAGLRALLISGAKVEVTARAKVDEAPVPDQEAQP